MHERVFVRHRKATGTDGKLRARARVATGRKGPVVPAGPEREAPPGSSPKIAASTRTRSLEGVGFLRGRDPRKCGRPETGCPCAPLLRSDLENYRTSARRETG